MDEALSNTVAESVSAERADAAHQQVHLSLEEMEQVLRYWESLDGVKWDDATRMECSGLIETQLFSVDDWKSYLSKVPDDVNERYRKVMKLLLEKKLITQESFVAELEAMAMFSPATLTRRGKDFADWYRAS